RRWWEDGGGEEGERAGVEGRLLGAGERDRRPTGLERCGAVARRQGPERPLWPRHQRQDNQQLDQRGARGFGSDRPRAVELTVLCQSDTTDPDDRIDDVAYGAR